MQSSRSGGESAGNLRPQSILRYPVDANAATALEEACRLAIRLCGRPMAAVELLDPDDVIIVAAVGMPAGRLPRSHSPCVRLLEGRGVVEVPDAQADGRFAGVGGAAGIGAYGAMVLESPEGDALGVLSVRDPTPGSLTAEQVESLAALGRMVMVRLNLGWRQRQVEELKEEHARVDAALREAEAKFRGIFENTVVGIYQTTPEGRYLSANPMLAKIYGYASPDELMNKVGDIERQIYVDKDARDRFVEALQEADTISEFEARIRRKDGSVIWIAENARVVRDAGGRVKFYEGTVQDITLRKQAENQVRNSEVLYHSLVEELPQNVFRKDLDERFIFANTRFCQTVGRSWDELNGRTDFDLYPKELARKYQEDDQRVIADGKTVRVTEANVTPDGETHWVEVIKTPLRDHTGKIAGIQGIFWDVTDTKRLQDELAYERDLLQALLDHSPDSIYFKDPQSRFVKVGRALARRFDLADPEWLVGRTAFELIDPALAAVLHEEEQQLLKSGTPIVNKVEQLVDQKGGRSWASATKVPIYDRRGRILGLVGVVRDITQLIETEQALRDAEEKYRAIFMNSVEGIFQTTLDGRFLQANPALARIYGFRSTEEMMEARTDVRTQVYVEPGRREEFVRQVLEHGSITGFESEVFRRDGTRTWVSESARVVRDAEGDPQYFEGTIEEITARKQIEGEREKARKAALESVRMKSEFVATVSHEIRTPLNAIVPSTDQLLRTRLDRQQRGLVESIDYGSQMLLQIVNDILEVERIEAGAIVLEEIEFDLHELVERTVAFFATPAHAKRLELACNIHPGVPRRLRGDPARLGQILNNLFGNAIKFTDCGEVVIEVESGPVVEDRVELRFRVRDSGIGIAPEARARVFTAFAQADGSMARRYGGTGLGLTITRRFVELMGGDIDFESVVGQGTTFRFHVQLRPLATPSVEPSRSQILAGHRVLVVDDSVTQREVLTEALLELGATGVASAPALDRAVEELSRAAVGRVPYDLILFDAELPGNDLVQAVRRLRAGAAPGCRLVALTAPGAVADDRGLEAAGLAATWSKPIRQSRLPADLAIVLSGRGHREVAVDSPVALRDMPGSGLTLLLVEDNPLNQRVAVGLLQRMGARVDAAASGPEALAAVAREHYDLILMDCQMPDMDGYETTRRIRDMEGSEGAGRHVPIVALSANALAGDRERGLAAGMDDYLTKPLRQSHLIRILRDLKRSTETEATAAPDLPFVGAGPSGGGPEGADDDEPVLDTEPLRALGTPDDPSLTEFVGLFLSEAPGRLDRIAAAVASGDAERTKSESHSLKGSASYMGARRLVRECVALENTARAGNISDGAAAVDRMRTELQSACVALKAYLEKPAGEA